jgi:hypothetical protein
MAGGWKPPGAKADCCRATVGSGKLKVESGKWKVESEVLRNAAVCARLNDLVGQAFGQRLNKTVAYHSLIYTEIAGRPIGCLPC